MKYYQAMRISKNGVPTYGDKYQRIGTEETYRGNEIVEIGNSKYSILFEEEQQIE